jgi:hypothetical protein
MYGYGIGNTQYLIKRNGIGYGYTTNMRIG